MLFGLHAAALFSFAICGAESARPMSALSAMIFASNAKSSMIGSAVSQISTIGATGLRNASVDSAVYQHASNDSSEDLLAVAGSNGSTHVRFYGAKFAETCKPYPGKRVVMVSVSEEYLDMFRNWLHFAARFLDDTEQLVAVAEDVSAEGLLRQFANTTADGQPARAPRFEVVRSSGAAVLGADPNRTALRGALLEPSGSGEPDAPRFDSQSFGDLVTQRSTHMLALLNQGCTVLYSDIDNVWVKDPFRELARLRGKDLVATDDEPPNVTSHTYLCTCFLYVQPSRATEDLMTAWGLAAAGQRTNQRPFNAVLRRAQEAGQLTLGVLPASEFPPGNVASEYPNATIFHANWVSGLPNKVEFFEERGLWSVHRETLPQKVFSWAGSLAKNVTAWAHSF